MAETKNIKFTIEFLSYWHCGSGQAAGADVDALVVKDANDLPFVPGRTIKGLLREAYETLYPEDTKLTNEVFGKAFNAKDPQCQDMEIGKAFFGNATLTQDEHDAIAQGKLQEFIYTEVAQTAIGEDGVATEHSLRKTQVTVPCTLHGEISSIPTEAAEKLLSCLGFVKHIGLNRNRGLGRCVVTGKIEDTQAVDKQTIKDAANNTKLQFTCELLTDVILNQKSASDGENKTLDFIPGNCFLGIAASALYGEKDSDKGYPAEAYTLFHSWKVRFGDAHPLQGGKRSLRTPASFFFEKGKKIEDAAYVHHAYDREKDKEGPDGKEKQPMQLKQCRSGFYAFSDGEAKKVDTQTSYSIKSAYDRINRHAMDDQMFGYEALCKGITMAFTVEVEEEEAKKGLSEKIAEALVGQKRVGRSRSAQYGLVEIKLASFSEVEQRDGKGLKCKDVNGDEHSNCQTIYADSRLIFLDSNGLPSTRPTAQDLGFADGAEILWEQSQVRTFQYSPWNYKRQCFDADRFGIEKGSVFVVKNAGTQKPGKTVVGKFVNEGFGHVIFNPDFLDAKEGTNGEAKVKFLSADPTDKSSETQSNGIVESNLLDYAREQGFKGEMQAFILRLVNKYKKDNGASFHEEQFASQCKSIKDLKEKLYANDKSYLKHGTAADKWEDMRRLENLRNFIEKTNWKSDDTLACRAVVNLAAEMAKECRKQKNTK